MAGEEALIIHLIQKKIIRRFRDHCATVPQQAAALETIGVKQSHIFKSLLKKKVILAAEGNRYYLDEEAAEFFFQRKRRMALIAFSVVALAALLFFLIGRRLF